MPEIKMDLVGTARAVADDMAVQPRTSMTEDAALLRALADEIEVLGETLTEQLAERQNDAEEVVRLRAAITTVLFDPDLPPLAAQTLTEALRSDSERIPVAPLEGQKDG